MEAFASLNWSLPCDICKEYLEASSPAFWNDSVSAGATMSRKYRAVSVIGRRGTMVPLPLAASGLGADIAGKGLAGWGREDRGPGMPLPDEAERAWPRPRQQ